MSTDTIDKQTIQEPTQFALTPKIWANINWTEQRSVNDFLSEYTQIEKNRDRFSLITDLQKTQIEIHNGQATLRFYDGGSWTDNYYFTKFAWSKLGTFFPRYFSGFIKDCQHKFGEESEELIENLYENIIYTNYMSDKNLVFRLERDVDGKDIIRSVVSESFTELDDDLLFNKLREDKDIQDKYILNARVCDTYSNIRIGDTVPNSYELKKPISMVEWSNADGGGKAVKARSGIFTGLCWNTVCAINSNHIWKKYHSGDVNRVTESISNVYKFLFAQSEEYKTKYSQAQEIPVRIADNFRVYSGKGKKKKLITHGHLNRKFNRDIACKSFIEGALPNRVKPNGKHISSLCNGILTWNSPKMITETPSLARCIDALTLHAQDYNMEQQVDIEDYASYLLEHYVHKEEIIVEPNSKFVRLD